MDELDSSNNVNSPSSGEYKERLSFAISLIGLFVVILYTVIPKFFVEKVGSTWLVLYYLHLCIYVIIFTLLVFILLQGYALSYQMGSPLKRKMNLFCSSLYDASFFFIYVALIMVLFVYCLSLLNDDDFSIFSMLLTISLVIISSARIEFKLRLDSMNEEFDQIFHLLTFIFSTVFLFVVYGSITCTPDRIITIAIISSLLSLSILLLVEFLSKAYIDSNENSDDVNNKKVTISLINLILLFSLFILLNFNIPVSSIDLDMKSVYELDESPIPINVKINGLNGNLTVYLYKENEPSFVPVSSLKFGSKEEYDTVENNILRGIYLGNGEYEFYINSTEMNVGYYALKFDVLTYSKRTTFLIKETIDA
ncbi:hypothetical protein [Methanolobus sp. WCC4]|uniref:hypothetical protein n=1 Tax=Methanolobus sp. WCC4 TaxID=3125784 RepID=UPI0030F4C662